MTLEEYILQHAAHSPDRNAVIDNNGHITYAQLAKAIINKANTLLQDSNPIVIIPAKTCIDTIITYLAAHFAHKVALLLPSSTTTDTILQLTQATKNLTLPHRSADILFTSGTTDKPKAALISHTAILANAHNLISAQTYSPQLTVIIATPINHLGAISKIYTTLRIGATVHLINGLKDINAFIMAAEQASTQVATFLVPTQINILLTLAKNAIDKLNNKFAFIETGAAPISLQLMNRLRDTLPNTQLYNTYASTETGIVATYNFQQNIPIPSCVGKPIINNTISINQQQQIVVAGQTIMTSYIDFSNNSQPTNITPINHFTTHDLAHFNDNQQLILLGRNDEIINVGGYKILPTTVEHTTRNIIGVLDCALTTYPNPILGTALHLIVVKQPLSNITIEDIKQYLKQHLQPYQLPQKITFVSSIPRNPNGKLIRHTT